MIVSPVRQQLQQYFVHFCVFALQKKTWLCNFNVQKASKNYILDLCQLFHLIIWGHKMKTPWAYGLSGILEIN